MTPFQMKIRAVDMFGRTAWKQKLAQALGVNVCTIHRMMHRPMVPSVYTVAIEGLIEKHQAANQKRTTR